MQSYTQTKREADLRWLAHLGKEFQDILLLLVFCKFLAVIFVNVRLSPVSTWSQPREIVQDWVNGISVGVFMLPAGKGISQEFISIGQGLQQRHLTAVKTHRDTLLHRNLQETLNGGSRWLHTLTPIYQNPVYSGWQDRATAESTSLERWMRHAPQREKSLAAVARGHSQRFGGELVLHWGDNLYEVLDGKKIYHGLEKCHFLSALYNCYCKL